MFHRRRVVPALLALTLLAGCGSRLSQGELVALNGGSSTVTQDVAGAAPAAVSEAAEPATVPAPTDGTLPAAAPPVAAATTAATAKPGKSTAAPKAGTPASGTATTTTTGAKVGAAQPTVNTDNKPLTICSISELAGPVGAALADGVHGMQAWVGDVNARGGVAGHQIRLIVKDSGSDPNVALSHARACVENEGAVAIVGSMMPLTGRGMMAYLESKGVPAIGGDCGASFWNDSAVFYNQCPAVETSYWYLAYEAAHSGAANKKFAVMYCQEAQTCAEGKKWMIDQKFPEKNGLELAYTKVISLTQLDFTSECSAMKSAGVTSAAVVADPSTMQRLGQSCSRQGFNPIYVEPYASVAVDSPQKAGLGNITLGMPVMPFCCVAGKDAQNANYQRYLTANQRYGGGKPASPATALGFTAGLLFESFLQHVAKTTATVTPAALLKAAGGIKNDTLGGVVPPITLTAGQKTPDSKCWFVMQARSGGQWTAPNGLKMTCRK
jgi:ABC-type branched-subunit amino acid transport system substrate-binding protein